MRKVLNWRFQGDADAPAGYSYVAQSLQNALNDIGVDLSTEAQSVVFHTIPWEGFSWYEGQQAAILSMWEHSKLPEEICHALKLFKLALPPCEYSAEMFRPFVPSEVVPHGIDPTTYFPPAIARKRPEVLRVFTPSTNLRKGAPEVLEGAKRSGIPVHVTLKGKRGQEFCKPDDESCTVLSTRIEDFRSVYTQHDLCVSGSRGEGWDLISWEALACGVPTVVPFHTGYKEWAHLAQKRLHNFHEEPSKVVLFGDAGNWLVQDPDEIASSITECWDNYDQWAQDALDSANEIQRSWTWHHSAAKLVQALEKHGFQLDPFQGAGVSETHTPLVPVKCTESLMEGFDIGGFSIAPFREGVTYRVPCEVARVLTLSGNAEILSG